MTTITWYSIATKCDSALCEDVPWPHLAKAWDSLDPEVRASYLTYKARTLQPCPQSAGNSSFLPHLQSLDLLAVSLKRWRSKLLNSLTKLGPPGYWLKRWTSLTKLGRCNLYFLIGYLTAQTRTSYDVRALFYFTSRTTSLLSDKIVRENS